MQVNSYHHARHTPAAAATRSLQTHPPLLAPPTRTHQRVRQLIQAQSRNVLEQLRLDGQHARKPAAVHIVAGADAHVALQRGRAGGCREE